MIGGSDGGKERGYCYKVSLHKDACLFSMEKCDHVLERTSLEIILGLIQNCHLRGKLGLPEGEAEDRQLNSWGLTVLFEGATVQIDCN